MNVFVARQPVFNVDNEVISYELLYRKDEINSFNRDISGNMATSVVLLNSYYTFGINKLSEGKHIIINFEKEHILNDIPKLLNSEIVTLEVPVPLQNDKTYIRQLESLKQEGYKIAMELNQSSLEYKSIIELCDIVEVDMLVSTREEVMHIVNKCRGFNLELFAKKVETNETFKWTKKIGFDIFQGYYFCEPIVIKTKAVLASKINYIRIMQEIAKKEADYDIIAHLIEADPILTYRILKLVNANFVSYNKISTVKQALVTIGLDDLEQWISLSMIAELAENKPPEILKLAMLRGNFLYQIFYNCIDESSASEGMLIGLLSVIDVLTNQTMSDVLNELPVSSEIKKTLLLEDNDYNLFYRVVKFIEKGNYGEAFTALQKESVYVKDLMEYYYEAIKWSTSMYNIINAET